MCLCERKLSVSVSVCRLAHMYEWENLYMTMCNTYEFCVCECEFCECDLCESVGEHERECVDTRMSLCGGILAWVTA